MASFEAPSSSNEEKYLLLSLSAVNVSNFMSSKLWGDKQSNNYSSWKQQMLCLIESYDLLCFIINSAESTAAYAFAFPRTDTLLKGWILGSLSEPVLNIVANSPCATAKDVWLELEKNFISESTGRTLNITSNTFTQRDLNEYLPLYKAILQGDWKATKEILDSDPNASKARINSSKQTALHIAVATRKSYHFVESLVQRMPDDESRALKDDGGNTALSKAAAVGNKEAAVLLVNRMQSLLYVPDNFGNFPVHQAAKFPNRDMLGYLINQTRDDLEKNPYAGTDGLRLLTYVIDAEFFDVAVYLVRKYPYVATLKLADNTSALKKIAAKKFLLLRIMDISFWQRIPFIRLILKDEILLIQQALEFVKSLCEVMRSKSHEEAADIYSDAILTATELRSHEVVKQIVEVFPDAICCSTPSSNQSLLHVAALNRSMDIFKLIYQKNIDNKHLNLKMVDSDGNNHFHAAAKLAPSHQLSGPPSSTLRMARELRWFQMVGLIMDPNCGHQPNNAGKTPKMVFDEEHKTLKEEAQKWTEDVANSCMVVATLIATVTFAGSITVPGGNDNNSGFPTFYERTTFKVFENLNVGSFLMATLCLLILLVMLIWRFEDEDLNFRMPEILFVCFYVLLLSVTMMTASFLAATYLVAGKLVLFPYKLTILLACIPVFACTLSLMFPLRHYLHDMYGFIKFRVEARRLRR